MKTRCLSLLTVCVVAISTLLGVQTPAFAIAQEGGTLPPCNRFGDACTENGERPGRTIACYMVAGSGKVLRCTQTCTKEGWGNVKCLIWSSPDESNNDTSTLGLDAL